jgi:hypothetical protein
MIAISSILTITGFDIIPVQLKETPTFPITPGRREDTAHETGDENKARPSTIRRPS